MLVTADLHYNHARSRGLADELIDRMNAAGGDLLLIVGDTAAEDGDAFERCLSRFKFTGPRLIVPGNHELWTHKPDSHALLTIDYPRRCQNIGWHWLPGNPFISGDVAIVGSIGWYDYSFASPKLGIPRRFYEKKVSPGVAARMPELAHLFDRTDDISPEARKLIARWNDGRHIRLGRSDEAFLAETLDQLKSDITAISPAKKIIAAIHHLPFAELLPPPHSSQWDFAKAYLGSPRIGEVLLRHENIARVFCGHSHWPAEENVGRIKAINIGSGYRYKTFWAGEI
jgi:predicted phosphodiesterase